MKGHAAMERNRNYHLLGQQSEHYVSGSAVSATSNTVSARAACLRAFLDIDPVPR